MNVKEFIIQALSECVGAGLTLKTLLKKIGASSKGEAQAVRQLLDQMEKEELLIYADGKYCLFERADVVKGRIHRHERGYAFLLMDGKDDLFIAPSNLNGAYQNDLVLAKKLALKGGEREEAEVIKIIERGVNELIGIYFAENGYGFVCPDDKSFGADIYIPGGKSMNAPSGQEVLCKITSYRDGQNPSGVITEVLGNPYKAEVRERGLILESKVPTTFPDEVLDEVNRLSEDISPDEWASRRDFCSLLTFTIDGDDARDFDDAISVMRDGDGYILYVHIADVSAFVKVGGAIDGEAYSRGTSIYLPSRVIPMLPERLCNGLCSLNPNVLRLAVSVVMKLDCNGVVREKSFYKSIIRSDYRLTYKNVQAIFDGDEELRAKYEGVTEALFCARELKDKMIALRDQKGAVDLDLEECKVYYDQNGELLVERRDGLESERLIEQFMIAANVAVAEFLHYAELPAVYRVHEKPTAEKVSAFCEFLKAAGVPVPRRLQYPGEFKKVLESVDNSAIGGVINEVMLRCMQKAAYSCENLGHFGLNEECYCHFTSPIRRYPDLFVHRVLKGVLEGRTGEIYESYAAHSGEIADNCSLCERRADTLEREIDKIYICQFMRRYLGDWFEGVISGVAQSGIFIRLENCAEGMILTEDLPGGSRYEFDKEAKRLTAGKRVFKLGDVVLAKLVSCDVRAGRIYFTMSRGKKGRR